MHLRSPLRSYGRDCVWGAEQLETRTYLTTAKGKRRADLPYLVSATLFDRLVWGQHHVKGELREGD